MAVGDTGRFVVDSGKHQLYFRHESLGRRAVPMERQPLVVALSKLPDHVHVTVSMSN